MKPAHFLLIGGLLLLVVGMSLVSATPGLAQGPTETPQPQGEPPVFLLDYYQAWVKSPHAKADAEAFVHWDSEGKIPTTCATCHSTVGYRDYLGVDGSAAGTVDAEAPIGTVVNCDACHNQAASTLSTVKFPSGAEVGDIGDSTRCIVCHQGRASTVQVNEAIEKAGLTADLNKPSPDLRFINIHYYAAAATLYGSETHGGYEYAGKRYQVRYEHVDGFNTCASCHNPHTLEVNVEACSTCHEDVKTVEDLRDIRMMGSLTDYDGDGDIEEGVAAEIESLQTKLFEALQAYAKNVVGTAIAYSDTAYPYFFVDTNENGTIDEAEATFDNGYKAFSGRLLQAAYNYQVSKKDPGGYAHNAAYHIELLYDSIEDLNKELGSAAIDVAQLKRNDPGHFDTTAMAFRYWDTAGEVPGTCAKCHTAGGLPVFLKNATNIAAKPTASLSCTTCHDAIPDFTVYEIEEVTFPSGAKAGFEDDQENNLCLNCHQGRESTVSVNRAIANAKVGDDEVSEALTFRNIHYFAAGASLFGDEVKGAYQYEGKEYNGRFEHHETMNTCTDCHDTHALELKFEDCTECHENAATPQDIRHEDNTVDYDGDGDVTEGIAREIEAMNADLLARIYAYAPEKTQASIVYTSAAHPYWYIDTNNNGQADADEVNRDNRFVKWTPNLLRAAYNYQYVSKDPGGFTHNGKYLIQVLYDSLESIGGPEAVAKYTRPEVVKP